MDLEARWRGQVPLETLDSSPTVAPPVSHSEARSFLQAGGGSPLRTPRGTFRLARLKETQKQGHFLWSLDPDPVISETLRGNNIPRGTGRGLPLDDLSTQKAPVPLGQAQEPGSKVPSHAQSHSLETPLPGALAGVRGGAGVYTQHFIGDPSSCPRKCPLFFQAEEQNHMMK